MSNRNRVILWVPTMQYLGGQSRFSHEQSFRNEGIYYRQHFYPTEVAPQGFPRNCDIMLSVDANAGFSFKELWFKEKEPEASTPIYDVSENSLLLPVMLIDINDYPFPELARYFKEYWMRKD